VVWTSHWQKPNFCESGVYEQICSPIRRLLLVIPTLWAITINFFIVQIALAARSTRQSRLLNLVIVAVYLVVVERNMPATQEPVQAISARVTTGGRGLDPEVIAEITHRYGFDKPIHERYFKMPSGLPAI
jgi:microcin C transport system permease protein